MGHFPSKSEFADIRRSLLRPEAAYYRLAIFFSAVISLLALAVPISIQMLIDQVANTALVQPVIILSASLFCLLLISGFFYAVREYVLELFERHIYTRLASEITLKVLEAPSAFFEQARRDDLLNRYFDIMSVKKLLPPMLVGLFSFFFQAVIGLAVTSLYHPALLVFNAVWAVALYGTWKIWSWRASKEAFVVSETKYDMAAWVEGLSHQADLYKAGPHAEYALKEANRLIGNHIGAMRRHFRLTFMQLLTLLFLYALASSSLLGIGGYLVIAEQLSLGQLVAAELILSAIFASFGTIASYFKDYYDMSAALEELNRINGIPDANPTGARQLPEGSGAVSLIEAAVEEEGYALEISFDVAAGANAQIKGLEPHAQRSIARLLKGTATLLRGSVQIDGVDVRDWQNHYLHEEVVVMNRPTVPQLSIIQLLRLARPAATYAEMEDALQAVSLWSRVSRLNNGMDTVVAPSGWPFTAEELLQLKLAVAILDRPRLLVLTDMCDCVPAEVVQATIAEIRRHVALTVLICSGRDDLDTFDDLTCSILNNDMMKEGVS